MFFERHMAHIIEFFVPGVTDPATVLNMVPLCNNYIKRLNISQLLPPIKDPQKEVEKVQGDEGDKQEEGELYLDLESETDIDGPYLDHFDFNIVLHKLTNLEELHLVYQVKNCGMNFEWSLFEMSVRDCDSLGKALKSCVTLKVNVNCDSAAPLCLLHTFYSFYYHEKLNSSGTVQALESVCIYIKNDSRAHGSNLNKSLLCITFLSHTASQENGIRSSTLGSGMRTFLLYVLCST